MYNPNEKHKQLCEELNDLYARKNADYGGSFSDSFEKWGLVSPLIRIGDKYNRLVTLAKNERRVNNESIRDTLIDLANYSLMAIMELDKQGGKIEYTPGGTAPWLTTTPYIKQQITCTNTTMGEGTK